MSPTILFLSICLISALIFQYARMRAKEKGREVGGIKNLSSAPVYYAIDSSLLCALPAALLLLCWLAFENQILQFLLLSEFPAQLTQPDLFFGTVLHMAEEPELQRNEFSEVVVRFLELQGFAEKLRILCVAALVAAGATWGISRVRPEHHARRSVEKTLRVFFFLSAGTAVLCTFGIVFSVLFEALRFFAVVPVSDFLFGLHWSPQLAMRPDQAGSSGAFGAVPLITGTLLIAAVALTVAAPVGLLSAIYLAEYASRRVRIFVKPMLEILAGIPTVVYGFFAVLTLAPLVRDIGTALGFSVASESALAAGLVMGVMTIPFISSLSDDVIRAVPDSLREASYGLGATSSETIRKVVLPAALPGLAGGILLAVSRTIGETMIVVMAAGLAANLTANPLESVTTVTVQIVTLLVGDQEFDSPKTLAAFALGLILFVVTLLLNLIALLVVRHYREYYE